MTTKDRGLDLSNLSPAMALIIRSVLPVFTNHTDRPEHYGTCVLVELDGHPLIVTAAHVIEETRKPANRFTVAVGGRLVTPLSRKALFTAPDNPMDIGVIPLSALQRDGFIEGGGVFLGAEMLDESEKGDGADNQNTLANVYLPVGFPITRSRIQHSQLKIGLKTFSARVTLAPLYPASIATTDQIVLEYENLLLEGRKVDPPKLTGMSGGGVFRYQRRHPETIKLVGILTSHEKRPRLMIGTKWGVAARIAREFIARYPEALE